jgi:hypothetical protein
LAEGEGVVSHGGGLTDWPAVFKWSGCAALFFLASKADQA